MESVQAQDESAFEELTARYGERIRRQLVGMVRDESAAGDLLQEVLVRVWRNASQWEGRGALLGWLMRIATNQALNHLQSKRRRRETSLEIPREGPYASGDGDDEQPYTPRWMVDPTGGPDRDVEQRERSEALRSAIASLPPEKREVFRMAHEYDMDMRSISETLGIPEGTVKSRLHYIMKDLTKQWDEMTTDTEE